MVQLRHFENAIKNIKKITIRSILQLKFINSLFRWPVVVNSIKSSVMTCILT